MAEDPWKTQVEALGRYIHAQRKLASLSLRELASLSDLSNAYLSQLERGLHQPSMKAVSSIAKALNLSTEAFLAHAGLLDDRPAEDEGKGAAPSTEDAIRSDPNLSDEQKQALLAVYRSYAEESSRSRE
jgi:transcriptional regulator with XRE-family HTH domain